MKQIVDKLNKIAKKINANVELSDRDLIIDSLDSITKAYGGTPNDSNLIVDKLEDIYNNIGSAPSGNIEITENGENINVAPYATATVNVSGGGGGGGLPTMALTIVNDTGEELAAYYDMGLSYQIANNYGIHALATVIEINETYEATVLYNYVPGLFDNPAEYNVRFGYVYDDNVTTASATNLDNCTFSTDGGAVKLKITDPSQPSSATVTITKVA